MIEDFKLYRWLKGGVWYLYKHGRDTPSILMFCEWSQEKPHLFDHSFSILIGREDYRKEKKGMGQWVLHHKGFNSRICTQCGVNLYSDALPENHFWTSDDRQYDVNDAAKKYMRLCCNLTNEELIDNVWKEEKCY